jgi:hypothetical protein
MAASRLHAVITEKGCPISKATRDIRMSLSDSQARKAIQGYLRVSKASLYIQGLPMVSQEHTRSSGTI